MSSFMAASCRGKIHVLPVAGGSGSGSGFYSVNPNIQSGGGGKVLIQSIPVQLDEIVQPSVTLDDERSLYVFGSAWSEGSINGQLLLGDSSTRGALLGDLTDWYEQNRVSKLRGPVQVSLGPHGINAFITGLRLGEANPEYHVQGFTILFYTPGEK